ncbi:hypothetical protein [Teredinibacter franksiae]|uniref:hypothetical protein n=1 Tax=Teredinibacter franksiae TaxID=2761453 RepID=UPI001626E41D|nr:hypothetical protein [Teredinibacter franksiae]
MKTLDALGKNWIFLLDRAAIYTLPLGILFGMFMVFTQTLPWKTCVLGVLGVSFTLSVVHQVCLYHFVKCPTCGWNLTIFKDGKKIQPKFLYNAFSAGKPCLNCGWVPGEPPTNNEEQHSQDND